MLDQFKILHWSLQFGVMLVIAGALVYAFDYFLLTSVRAETKTKTAELDKIRAENQQVGAVKNRLSEFKTRYEQLKVEYEQTKQLLPEAVEISKVLEQVQLLAKGKLKLKSFIPQEDQQKDFYRMKPIKVDVAGTYFRLEEFFQQVAELRRIVNVVDAEIKGAQQQQENLSLDASFTVLALYANAEDVANLKTGDQKKADGKDGKDGKADAGKDAKKK